MRTLPKCPIKFEPTTTKLIDVKVGDRKIPAIVDKNGVVRPIPKLY
jgi:hypothetical protein